MRVNDQLEQFRRTHRVKSDKMGAELGVSPHRGVQPLL